MTTDPGWFHALGLAVALAVLMMVGMGVVAWWDGRRPRWRRDPPPED